MSNVPELAARTSSLRRPAMTDVAKLAGVSHQTVSRVINDVGPVHPDTRRRVRAAIEELGYRRNSAARTLVTGRSQTIGVISFESTSTLYGPASTLAGIEAAVREAGYFVLIVSIHSLDEKSLLEAADRLIAQSVEGIVVVAPLNSVAQAIRSLPEEIPIVLLHGGSQPGIPVVTIDHGMGARLATDHLLGLGHQSVAYIAGPPGWAESREREEGWAKTLEAAGVEPSEPVVGDWSAESGYLGALKLAKRRDVTAIFAANDQMALGALLAMHELGRPVPDDVSIAGFDDIPEAAYLVPPLTTVRQDFSLVGRRSLESLLLASDQGKRVESTLMVPPELVVRQSTAPPRNN